VAIVEDEPIIREELAFQLRHLGFEVETFETAAAFYRFLVTRTCILTVLDIGLEGEDGLSVCQHLRAHDAHMGIVFVTGRAMRDERLAGLSAGADAYLTKPVDTDELALILRRLAARHKAAGNAGAADGEPPPVGGWHLDRGLIALHAPNAMRVPLTVNELQLLGVLTERAGEICNYVELATALGIEINGGDKHRIEVIVSRLRQKIERETGLKLPLRTVRNCGYLLEQNAAPL